MLGVCTAVSATSSSGGSNELIPTGGVSVIGNTTETTTGYDVKMAANQFLPMGYHLKIEPGLSGLVSDFATELLSGASVSEGKTQTSEFARWGLVTSSADTNPQILVKKIDVRRRKVYSKEG